MVTKKVSLPLLSDVFADVADERETEAAPKKKPSVDAARARLGGRIVADEPSESFHGGQHVSFERAPGERGSGVVLYASAREVHVLLDPSRLRRFGAGELVAEAREPGADLAKVAADARVFGGLREGQDIRYADDTGSLRDGKVVERCRYGALVLRTDGVVVAVGFRKLWPAPSKDGLA